MFLSISLYIIAVLMIWWSYCGYLFIIYLLSLFSSGLEIETPADDTTEVLSFTVLVPCYNEEDFAKEKVDNLKALEYPRDKLKIYFLDGSSTDSTVQVLEEAVAGEDSMQVIQTGTRGKINQINHYLKNLDTDVIVNTDMDALLQPDVLMRFLKVFQKNPDVHLVGASVYPENCNNLERHYWATQNWFRFLESKVISSSIVVAPCYAFRREALSTFPDDCVADDIYISFLTNTTGKKTIYLEKAIAHELRNPNTIEELITHKFRKANAYITEILRFLYLLPRMSSKWKMIYLTKLLQVVIMPWILIFFLLGTASFFLSGVGPTKLAISSLGFLFLSMAIGHLLVKNKIKSEVDKRYAKRSSLAIFLLTNLVLFIAGISYPFYIQTSSYQKVGSTKNE